VFHKKIIVYSIIKELLYKRLLCCTWSTDFYCLGKREHKRKEKKRVFVVFFFKTKALLIAYF